jgi:2-polyprenyl-6-methoxyphenol hydroxylase-like FAD-dependent oxidoreductase
MHSGIAGLTAALAMRAYADVLVSTRHTTSHLLHANISAQVLEAAHELKEIGAAVTLGSGVVNMMRRWGVRLEDAKPVSPQIFQTWSADGQLLHETPFGHGGAQNNDTVSHVGTLYTGGGTYYTASLRFIAQISKRRCSMH